MADLQDLVELPNIPGNIRFVQMVIDGKDGLASGPEDDSGTLRHRSILAAFLIKHDIHYEVRSDKENKSAPALKGKRYEVIGAGFASVDYERRVIYVFESGSAGYGIYPNPGHFRRIEPQLSGLKVVFL